MIPVTQTKVVVKNSQDEYVVRGNCFAAVVASILELPITEVPNVEVFFHMQNSGYWQEVMFTFLQSKGWELCDDRRFSVYHGNKLRFSSETENQYLQECQNKYYLVSGKSARGVHHICIYQNGKLVHDPHPSREGLLTEDYFQTLEKVSV